MYSFLKSIFFRFDPERAHYWVMRRLKQVNKLAFVRNYLSKRYAITAHPDLKTNVFGLEFKNPIGLAAGFDKDARFVDDLESLGFGFIEIGTVTPLAQDGNDKPRLFRLPKDYAIINRMGFNNEGAAAAVERLKNRKGNLIIGGNIGKNKITPNDKAEDDYEKCFRTLYHHVDYFTVNVSSPNTPGLRELQDKEPLKKLLIRLQDINKELGKNKPILLKIAPDLGISQLDEIIEIIQEIKLDGLVATNTTIGRDGLLTPAIEVKAMGNGGLSGFPVKNISTKMIRYIHQKSKGSFPIIAVGGIFNADDALEKLNAGASLVQIYTGFIYEGPDIVKNICSGLLEQNTH